MPLPHSLMQQEIRRRLARVRAAMREKSYDALIVYGDNKVRGSLRYLTDYFPDRAGWVSLGATETYLFEGPPSCCPRKAKACYCAIRG